MEQWQSVGPNAHPHGACLSHTKCQSRKGCHVMGQHMEGSMTWGRRTKYVPPVPSWPWRSLAREEYTAEFQNGRFQNEAFFSLLLPPISILGNSMAQWMEDQFTELTKNKHSKVFLMTKLLFWLQVKHGVLKSILCNRKNKSPGLLYVEST